MALNNSEHAALLAAYEAGDAEAVYTQTRSHLEHTRDAVVEYVNQWLAAEERASDEIGLIMPVPVRATDRVTLSRLLSANQPRHPLISR